MSDTGSIVPTITSTGDPAWLVRTYDAVKELFGDPRLGRSHPDPENAPRIAAASPLGRPPGNTGTEREDHARMRGMLNTAFSTRRMRELRPRVQQHVDRLLDDLLERRPPTDFHEALSSPLPSLVIAELLGIPAVRMDDFRRWSEEMGNKNDAVTAQNGFKSLHTYIAELVEEKRECPGEDVISDLVGAAQAGKLSSAEIVKYAIMLLFAGHVTTATAIDKGIVLLSANPAQRAALWKDPALVPKAVEEILRAPFPEAVRGEWNTGGTPRYANTDFRYDGVEIKAGDLVLLGRPAANVDSSVFTDPDDFRITRQESPHLSFGHGPHYCLGAPLARIELNVVFETIPRRVPGLRLAVALDEIHRRTDLLFGKLAALPVTW